MLIDEYKIESKEYCKIPKSGKESLGEIARKINQRFNKNFTGNDCNK